MTNSELRKALVVEMNKKKPNQSKIDQLNSELDRMAAEVEARGVQEISGSFGAPEPMSPAKTVPVELKSKAYRAMSVNRLWAIKKPNQRLTPQWTLILLAR